MFKKPPFIHKNQYMKTIDHATEFEKLRLLNMGCPNFEDDPAAYPLLLVKSPNEVAFPCVDKVNVLICLVVTDPGC